MYRLIKHSNNTSLVQIYADLLLLYIKPIISKKPIKKKFQTTLWNLNLNEIWISGGERDTQMKILNDVLLYGNEKNLTARRIDDINKVIYSLNYRIYITDFAEKQHLYHAVLPPNNRALFNIETGEYNSISTPSEEWYTWFYTKDYFVCSKTFSSALVISDHSFNVIWERDISVEGQHKHWMTWEKSKKDEIEKGRIRSVILYEEKYVIISMESSDSICLELATGKEVWRSGGNIWLSCVVGNIAYCTTNRSIWKLNLETGEEYKYQWEHSAPPDFEYKEFPDHQFMPYIHGMEYHEGLLWLLSYSSGASFIIAMHPETGNYEWIHRINTTDKVMSMKFHGNRIYFNSTNDLFVYERE